jgi:hypothetical protein
MPDRLAKITTAPAFDPKLTVGRVDVFHRVYAGKVPYGHIRENTRTGDFHAVACVRGNLKGRYFSTAAGAARWLVRTKDAERARNHKQ